MAQIKWMDEKLWQWGAWATSGGRDRLGLRGTVLGRMIKLQNGRTSAYDDGTCARALELFPSDDEALRIDRAICALPPKLRLAVQYRYERRLPGRASAGRLKVSLRQYNRWIEVAQAHLVDVVDV